MSNNNCEKLGCNPLYHFPKYLGSFTIKAPIKKNEVKPFQLNEFLDSIEDNLVRDSVSKVVNENKADMDLLKYSTDIFIKRVKININIPIGKPIDQFATFFFNLVNILSNTHSIEVMLFDYYYLQYFNERHSVHTNYRLTPKVLTMTTEVSTFHFYTVLNDYGTTDLSRSMKEFHPHLHEIYELLSLDDWFYINPTLEQETDNIAKSPSRPNVKFMPSFFAGEPYRLDSMGTDGLVIDDSISSVSTVFELSIWRNNWSSVAYGKDEIEDYTYVIKFGSIFIRFISDQWITYN